MVEGAGEDAFRGLVDGDHGKRPDEDRDGKADEAVIVVARCGIDPGVIMPDTPDSGCKEDGDREGEFLVQFGLENAAPACFFGDADERDHDDQS